MSISKRIYDDYMQKEYEKWLDSLPKPTEQQLEEMEKQNA